MDDSNNPEKTPMDKKGTSSKKPILGGGNNRSPKRKKYKFSHFTELTSILETAASERLLTNKSQTISHSKSEQPISASTSVSNKLRSETMTLIKNSRIFNPKYSPGSRNAFQINPQTLAEAHKTGSTSRSTGIVYPSDSTTSVVLYQATGNWTNQQYGNDNNNNDGQRGGGGKDNDDDKKKETSNRESSSNPTSGSNTFLGSQEDDSTYTSSSYIGSDHANFVPTMSDIRKIGTITPMTMKAHHLYRIKRHLRAKNQVHPEMDQLYLTDCVGKAGCKTRGYMIPPPGPFVRTRNVVDLRLKHIKSIESIDTALLNKFEVALKVLGILMMVSGALLFILIMASSASPGVCEFLHYFLKDQAIAFTAVIGNVIHPLVTGFYCLFAIHHLDQIRPYILRIPFTLVFPLALFFSGIGYLNAISKELVPYLIRQIRYYDKHPEVRDIWDDIQSTLRCCGVREGKEWELLLTNPGKAKYPKSCCIDKYSIGCPEFVSVAAFYSTGCIDKLTTINTASAAGFCVLAFVQFFIELTSIILMKQLYNIIQEEVDDSRSNCKILMGKCFSICDSKEFENRQELAEQGQLDYEDTVRPLPSTTSYA